VTRSEARAITESKLRALRELPPEELVQRYGVPTGGGVDHGVDEVDPVSGKPYMCVIQALHGPPGGDVRLIVIVSPRTFRLRWGTRLHWLLPVRRSLRLPVREPH
jgi:hypothetical protein